MSKRIERPEPDPVPTPAPVLPAQDEWTARAIAERAAREQG
jgi:hypothetical protein